MAFSRASSPEAIPQADELTARLVGIGMNFAAKAQSDADIENTILHASVLGMDEGDLRVLAVLTTWLGVHHSHVNADRLVRLVGAHPSERVHAYWAAIATWLKKDRRLARLTGAYAGPPIELLPTGTAFQIKRRGEDARFVDSPLRAPDGTLRDRPEDVLSPEMLVRRHAGYHNRVLMGPSFRADVWTVLEKAPGLRGRRRAARVVLVRDRMADAAGLPPAASRDFGSRERERGWRSVNRERAGQSRQIHERPRAKHIPGCGFIGTSAVRTEAAKKKGPAPEPRSSGAPC